MRKPRDIDSELKALEAKAKTLKERRVRQLGDLVIATGADTLDADLLTGALIGAVATKATSAKEGWRKGAARFFQRAARQDVSRSGRSAAHVTALHGHP